MTWPMVIRRGTSWLRCCIIVSFMTSMARWSQRAWSSKEDWAAVHTAVICSISPSAARLFLDSPLPFVITLI